MRTIFALALVVLAACSSSSPSEPSGPPDAAPDAQPDARHLGTWGDSCTDPYDCEHPPFENSFICSPEPMGPRVCTKFCNTDQDCPQGWSCATLMADWYLCQSLN